MTTIAEAALRVDEQLAEYGCTRRDIEQIDFSVRQNGTVIAYCHLRNGDAVAVGFHLHGQPLDEERVTHALSDVGTIH